MESFFRSDGGMFIRKPIFVVLLLLAAAATVAMALAVRRAQLAARDMRIFGRLYQTRFAMELYEELHGELPPLQILDEDGEPTFNWLVSLLPQFEREEMYAALDFSRTWDDEHNLAVSCSDRLFYDFATGDGYTVCPLDGDESIWNAQTGLPLGRLHEMSTSIALIAIPQRDSNILKPLCVSKSELNALTSDGTRCFFIRANGEYGYVTNDLGNITFCDRHEKQNRKNQSMHTEPPS